MKGGETRVLNSRSVLLTVCATAAIALGAKVGADDETKAAADGAGGSVTAGTGTDDPPWQYDIHLEPRAEFLTALSRAQAGAAATAADDSPGLRAYPLYPYLTAARIEHALARATGPAGAADAAAERFVDAHRDDAVGQNVRRAWLASLARREEWRAFLGKLDDEATSDRTLRCQALNARIGVDEIEGLAPRIVDVWLTGNQLPLECEPAFQWLRAEGLLTDELIERRVGLLLDNNQTRFARIIARRLPDDRATPLLRRADLLEQPLRGIDAAIAAPDVELPAGALLEGWTRLARNDPAAALERYAPLLDAFDLDRRQASPYALALALGLAWDRRSEALDFFATVDPGDLNDYALTWLARAALWSGDFQLADDAINLMSDTQRSETRWRYWAARAAEQRRDRSRARELYRSVLPTDNYYAAMAAARLDEAAQPHDRPLAADGSLLQRIASLPEFVRARELKFARLPWLAVVEWRRGLARLDEADRPTAIHVAARWGWYDVAVATATQHRVFNAYELLYPRPYDDAVAAAADMTRLEAPLIYGLIRQESLFRADAASGAGAVGLAQLLPDTAKRAARRWAQPVPSYADLFVPATNVKLGAAELRSLIDEFDGQIEVGLAGYNAGPNAARRWLPERPVDADVWIENIPYNETRGYVQRVLWHSLVYAWLESGEPRSTEGWLAQVSPVGPESRELHAER